MKLSGLVTINEKAIQEAGPRYTPGIDSNAPNIQIRYLKDALEALSLAEGFRDRLRKLEKNLEAAHERARLTNREIFKRKTVAPEKIQAELATLIKQQKPKQISEWAKKLKTSCIRINRHLENAAKYNYVKQSQLGDDQESAERRRQLDSQVRVKYLLC